MLFGVHVYVAGQGGAGPRRCRRGEEAYRAARLQGDRSIEFLAAGGVALTHLELGEVEEAERWLELAAPTRERAPTPTRTRQIPLLARHGAGARRGRGRACAGTSSARWIATTQGRPAARCEALAAARRRGGAAAERTAGRR